MRFGEKELSTCLEDFRQFCMVLRARIHTTGPETKEEEALMRYAETDSFTYYAMMMFFQYRSQPPQPRVIRRIP